MLATILANYIPDKQKSRDCLMQHTIQEKWEIIKFAKPQTQ